ncbi:hypothetical protein BOTBODRAFT_350340 [Botryobasidium botryosum FD-172 SS1]|uniref:Uncharacterized protein n=1 Tax=Botryobasidium botryosum (strain FD-172 SS1) TaxID=930990 RepID=A0A067MFW6_BOTB1|nr:hypothetical protein BOTBODRAFT_350340 [Botryobasidium botryosum FD-172 SS1]
MPRRRKSRVSNPREYAMPGIPRKWALEEEDKESTPSSPPLDTTAPSSSPHTLVPSPKDAEMALQQSEKSDSESEPHNGAASDSEHE